MALKQILFSEDAFNQLPEIVNLIQSETFPDSALVEVFSNISSLIYGTYTQRKMGLAILECCLSYLYRSNKMIENIDYLLKWWKGMVNCMKSRYTADCTYRLACTNAMILSQISPSYVDLQMEGRSNVLVMVNACLTHVCEESLDLLLILCDYYPSHVGKQYDEIKSFCISHIHDDFSEKSGLLLGRLACVGPAGKQSVNYIQSWSKVLNSCIENIKHLLSGVVGQDSKSDVHNLMIESSDIIGGMNDVLRVNKEITFIFKCFKSLFEISIEAPMTFPLKSFKSMLEMIHTVYSGTILYISTADNFNKKSVINHAISNLLDLLNSVLPVLHSTTHLIQQPVENICLILLQQSQHCLPVLRLLSTMVDVGCTILTVPYVTLMDFLSLQSLHIKGPVSKKQKAEQFNTFTFETSTLGYHSEEKMLQALVIMKQILTNSGTSLSSFKVDILRSKCENIISNKDQFSAPLIQVTYETLIILSRQSFDVQSILALSSMSKEAKHQAFFDNQIVNIEPHLHPERYSFRKSAALEAEDSVPSHVENTIVEDVVDDLWDKENTTLFEDIPDHSKEMSDESDSSDQDVEIDDTAADKASDSCDNEDQMEIDLIGDSQLLEKIKSDYVEDVSIPVNEPMDDMCSGAPLEPPVNSDKLQDILSSFVDEPPSSDEA